ncbi:MAG TPA: hypothetical protein VKQ11_18840 [Candidatus Sulfotelmatobacter sp.]|nr:hypothetical protein [Candidatus Sulfotelmatobacter sp.]
MRRRGHDCDVIQNAAVDFSLTRKASQSVPVTLYFVSVNRPVHHRYINARNSLAQAEFLHYSSVGFPGMKALIRPQFSTDIDVTHG